MAGRRELGMPKTSASSLREQFARNLLQRVRSQGHPYVELREDGKRFVFFCTLCLSPCYSDTVLLDHLKGNLHTQRLSSARLTLLKPNPWPFSDGVHFFDNSSENEKKLAITNGNQSKWLESEDNSDKLAGVNYGGNLELGSTEQIGCDKDINGNEGTCDLVIPGVLGKNGISDLMVRFMGFGQIAARIHETDEGPNEISRIWCEWLGKKDSFGEDTIKVLDHEFSVVAFSYSYQLARDGLFDDVKLLLSSGSFSESENGEGTKRKRKKTFSDPEDISHSLSNQYDSSGEESSNSNDASFKSLLNRYDDHLLDARFISNKTVRREVRRQQRIAAERMCSICQQKMLPGKDVATLVNRKTGKLACSSRNFKGKFHLFHTSCLIHWVLLCEFEMLRSQSVSEKMRRKSRRKNGGKCDKTGKNEKNEALSNQIDSVFCPECQGTGINTEGDEPEKATILLSEMFKYKIKVSDGHRAWMKSPEMLQNCSTGFHFPSQSEQIAQELVVPLKLLHFYRAEDRS